MARNKFKISRFTNPSGEEVWRLSGTLNGDRIRRNYSTRAQAVAERQRLEIRALNEVSDGQSVWTTLTHDQNRDAIAAVNILKKAGSAKSLTFAVNYLLEHYKEASEQKQVPEAVAEYLDERWREKERGIISGRQERAIRIELEKFRQLFGERIIGEVRAEELKAYLDSPLGRSVAVPSLKTWNNRRGYLSTFFKFCLSKKYLAEDPVKDVPQFKIKKARGTAETLRAVQARELMHWLEEYRGFQRKNGSWQGEPGYMVPYYALTLFAGIRPDWKDGEIGKLLPRHVRLDTEVILIEPSVSKVNEKRVVKIQPNLRAWLEAYPLDRYPILPPRCFKYLLEGVRKEWRLAADVMRHTYISMTVGAFRSVGDAALQAGNSEDVIRKHYLDLKSVQEADDFWQIMPKGVSAPQWRKEEGRYVRKGS